MIRCLAFVFLAGPAAALSLDLPPGAEETRVIEVPSGVRHVPTGPARDGVFPTTMAQGAVSIAAYRLPDQTDPTGVFAALTAAVTGAGYQTLLACAGEACGGFDFRFGLQLIPPPDMFVDLSDFLYLSATSPDGADFVTLVASHSQTDGYLHVVRVMASETPAPLTPPPPATPPDAATDPEADATIDAPVDAPGDAPVDAAGDPTRNPAGTPTANPTAPGGLAAELDAHGHSVLEDLVFASGSTTLPDDLYPSLTALAEYLRAHPDRRVALVGHTDSSGALQVNISISKRRAEAARTKLIERYGISPSQVEAQGMGYLAPRASNLTQDGRDRNRRVEAIVTSTAP